MKYPPHHIDTPSGKFISVESRQIGSAEEDVRETEVRSAVP
jgi:hypothetical protein